MIPWKTFSGRRKIDLAALIDDANITTYEALVEHLSSQSVGPPTQGEFDSALKSTPATPAKAKKSRRSTSQKSTQKKSENTDNPDEVWQDGLEGSYQTKKTARKPRATRKTSTRKKS